MRLLTYSFPIVNELNYREHDVNISNKCRSRDHKDTCMLANSSEQRSTRRSKIAYWRSNKRHETDYGDRSYRNVRLGSAEIGRRYGTYQQVHLFRWLIWQACGAHVPHRDGLKYCAWARWLSQRGWKKRSNCYHVSPKGPLTGQS